MNIGEKAGLPNITCFQIMAMVRRGTNKPYGQKEKCSQKLWFPQAVFFLTHSLGFINLLLLVVGGFEPQNLTQRGISQEGFGKKTISENTTQTPTKTIQKGLNKWKNMEKTWKYIEKHGKTNMENHPTTWRIHSTLKTPTHVPARRVGSEDHAAADGAVHCGDDALEPPKGRLRFFVFLVSTKSGLAKIVFSSLRCRINQIGVFLSF